MIERLRERISEFLTELEKERLQVDLANRRRPQVGALYGAHSDLFSTQRITEVQRELAGSGGVEERRIRSILEFMGMGRGRCQAAEQLDQLLSWEVFGAVPVGDNRIPVRQIAGALGVAAEGERRHQIEEAYLDTLDEQGYLAEDYLAKQREAIGELGYGTHVEAVQVLGSIDLQAIARKGDRFLTATDAMYRKLLARHLPDIAGVGVEGATAADGMRLQAAPAYDRLLTGSEKHRATLMGFQATGLDPFADGRILVDWEAYLGATSGATCHPVRVPDEVHLLVTPRAGRPATQAFLQAYGLAFHNAFTDPELPVEHRRLGDESVPLATGGLFQSLLRTPAFLRQVYGVPDAEIEGFLSLSVLCSLLDVRREVARLKFELAWYSDEADGETFSEIFENATGLRHDARAAVWEIDGDFRSARRLRAAQLSGILVTTVRNRFDEGWFRNPDASDFLRTWAENGRRYSAPELSVQLSSAQLSYGPLIEHFESLV